MALSRLLDRWGEFIMNAVGEEGRRGYRGGRSWWDEIDDSREWQDGIFFALCVAYALVSLVSLVALVQLFRIQTRVPEYGWTTQKVFHLMNFAVNGMRAILFGLHRSVFVLKPKVRGLEKMDLGDSSWGFQLPLSVIEMALLETPSLLFFSTYTLLVLFWAEIYYQARGLPIDGLRPAYLLFNGLMYVLQVSIWIYVQLSQKTFAVEVAKLFFAVVSFFAALGFVIYGGRLFIMLRRFPIESKGRRKKLNEVGLVTSICCTCFLIRCFVVALSAFDKKAELDVLNHPILNFVYYTLVEILPSSLVIFILRKLPPKRVSDRYHPIN